MTLLASTGRLRPAMRFGGSGGGPATPSGDVAEDDPYVPLGVSASADSPSRRRT